MGQRYEDDSLVKMVRSVSEQQHNERRAKLVEIFE